MISLLVSDFQRSVWSNPSILEPSLDEVKIFILHCCGIFWQYLKIKTIVYCCLSEKNVGHQSLTPKRHAWYMQGSNTMRNLPNSMPKLYS